jgi:hypothetical protein
VWLRCDKCEKSDHFLFDGAHVDCDCGARYDHAVCLCGERVEPTTLTFTPFEDGPMALADLEWDPKRLTMLIGVALVLGASAVLAIWSWLP